MGQNLLSARFGTIDKGWRLFFENKGGEDFFWETKEEEEFFSRRMGAKTFFGKKEGGEYYKILKIKISVFKKARLWAQKIGLSDLG